MYDRFLNELKGDINSLKQTSGITKEKDGTHTNIMTILEKHAEIPIDEWSDGNLQLIHVILHSHFKNKKSSKNTIIKLHNSIVLEMQQRSIIHTIFDGLDSSTVAETC